MLTVRNSVHTTRKPKQRERRIAEIPGPHALPMLILHLFVRTSCVHLRAYTKSTAP